MADKEGCTTCKLMGVVLTLWGVILATDAVGWIDAHDVPGTGLPDWLQGIIGTLATAIGGGSVWYNFFRKKSSDE